jgi:hypothetical protein
MGWLCRSGSLADEGPVTDHQDGEISMKASIADVRLYIVL